MRKSENKLLEIFNLCKLYYKYEKFTEFSHTKTEFKGYLIKYELIDKFKKKISYKQIKNDIINNIDFKEIKNKIKINKEVIKDIVQIKFNNSRELLNELKNKKKFYLINIELWENICKIDKKEEIGIDCIIKGNKVELNINDQKSLFSFNRGIIEEQTKDNKEIISFEKNENINIKSQENINNLNNSQEKLEANNNINMIENLTNSIQNINLNNNSINVNSNVDDKIITINISNNQKINNKSNSINFSKPLINDKEVNDKNIENEKDNLKKSLKEDNPIFLFKKEINIIILIIYYKEELITELKESKKDEKNNKKYSYFLINKEWLDKFKSLFFYEKIKKYLEQKNYNFNSIKGEKGNNIIKEVCKYLYDKDNNYENLEKEKLELYIFPMPIKLLKIKYSENISYPVEFDIINEYIYNKFKSINKLNDVFKKFEKQKMIVNNGQILSTYNISSYKNYNILISNYKNEMFMPEIILCFNEQENMESIFDILTNCKNIKYNINSKDIEIELNSISVGKIYKLIDDNNNNKETISLDIDKNKENNNKPLIIEEINVLSIEMQKRIIVLINYIKFRIDLDQKLKLSKNNKPIEKNLSFINKDWMNNYKKFYNYENIINEINLSEEFSLSTIEKVLKNTDSNLLKIFKEKQNYEINNFRKFYYEVVRQNIDNETIYYPNKFDIIDINIFNEIFNNENIKNSNCIINNEKIIIYFNYDNQLMLLILNEDFKNNIINIEFLMKYFDENSIKNHFNLLKQLNYQIFLKKYLSKDQIYLLNEEGKPIGKFYIFDKYGNLIKKELNLNNNQNTLNDINKKHIEILLSIYFNNERINYKINQLIDLKPNIENYYLINEEILNKLKLLYNYGDLMKSLSETNIVKLISQYKSDNSFIKQNKLSEFLNQLITILPNQYLNIIIQKNNNNLISFNNNELFKVNSLNYKNSNDIYYYNNIELVDEETEKIINNNGEINQSLVRCIFGQNLIFILFKNLINIGKLDYNNIFKTEIIAKNDSQENNINFEPIIKQIKDFEFNGFKSIIFFNNDILNSNIDNSKITIVKLSENNDNFLFNEDNNKNDLNNNGYTKLLILNEGINQNVDINNSANNKQILLKNNINNENKNNSLNDKKQEEELKQKDYTKNKELKNIVLFFIDYNEIKNKMENALIQNYNEYDKNNIIKFNIVNNYYYLINKDWFSKYLEITNMKNIFEFLLNNEESFKTIINEKKTKNEKISQIILKIDNKLLENINNNKINYSLLEDFNLINIKTKFLKVSVNKHMIILENFLLLKEDTYKLLMENIKSRIIYSKQLCLFGNNKLFLIIMDNEQYTIEIGYLNNRYNNIDFNWEMFLDFNDYNILTKNINKIIENDYSQYYQNSLAFTNSKENRNMDYVSPIFNSKSQIVGYAYKYHISISNYINFHINNHLKYLIMYYLYNKQLNNLSSNDIKFENYFLVNKEYLLFYKNFFNYTFIKNEILKNKSNSILNNIKIDKFDDNFLITEKKLIFFIKNNLLKTNISLNEKQHANGFINNSQIEPDLPIFYYQNNKYLMYYSNFEILNETMYNLIFKRDELNKQKNNYIQCLLINKLIMIKLSENITGINQFVIEVGIFNSDNIFCPNYILIYKEERDFYIYINYIRNRFQFDILTFFKGLSFNKGNSLPLYDENEKEIGRIYNLMINNQNNLNPKTHQNLNQNFYFNNFKNNINIVQQNIINPKTFQNNQGPIHNYKGQQLNQLSIKNDFPFPPLIGLQNVGATCYMNATLQCFCQIEELVNYFKYKPYIDEVISKYKNENKDCLTTSFKYLVENIWPSRFDYINNQYNHQNTSNKYFAPYKFKEKISKMNPLFQGAKANDSKDLVNFIIMTLHEELNKAKKSSNLNNNQLIDQTNKKLVFDLFTKSFQNENKSIISDIFYGISNTTTKCSGCNIIKYNFQLYFFLIFPLEEIRKFKIDNMMNNFILMNQNMFVMNPMLYQQYLFNFNLNIQNINSVNIYECFEYNQKLETFTKDNSMYCNTCKKQMTAFYQTKLYASPEILVIVLNRGKGIEYKVKLDFSENLNLSNFIEHKETGYNYRLIGVVTHMGESGASGHFIAYCKNPIDCLWYKYNDDLISKVINFKQEIIDYAMPYILFFKKVDKINKINYYK